MTVPSSFIKDPAAVLDYEVDWSTWLADGETIATSTVTVEDGLDLDSDTNTDTVVTAWLSGGTVGENYTVTSQITTSQSRTDERSITIHVRER